MNILDTIIAKKRIEVAKSKVESPVAELEKRPFFKRKTYDFGENLLDKNKSGIIAEFKRKSPSKGIINDRSLVEKVTNAYAEYGASAISVLTDESFFGGSLNDLLLARKNEIPILRKDFMIDEYQLIEAKAFGADIILLIAACLKKDDVKQLSSFAKNIGLNVLLEIHDENELEHICDSVDVVGINNRNLKTFSVDLARSVELAKNIPEGKIKIAESGIDSVETIHFLKNHGFDGFLIGECFMKESNPVDAFREFSNKLNYKKEQ